MEDQNQPQQVAPAQPPVAYAQPVVGGKSSKKKAVLAWLVIFLLGAGIAGTYVWQHGQVNDVIWWEDGNDMPASASTPPEGFMRVADKRVVEFLSTIPMDDIVKFCQTDFDTKTGFQMGVYDTDKKTLTLRNQYQNCIDAVAASNGKYAPQAEQVLKDSKADLDAWAKSLTVTKK
jgi:hypothetical protein